MRRVPINWEMVFWLLCGVGLVLAFWHYGTMISDYTD